MYNFFVVLQTGIWYNEPMETLQWSVVEYEEKERSADWFWALGIIIVAGSIAAIIFGDFFFAILLVVGGACLAMFAVRKPETITYELAAYLCRLFQQSFILYHPYRSAKQCSRTMFRKKRWKNTLQKKSWSALAYSPPPWTFFKKLLICGYWSRRSMDRTQLCGSCDAGSIPAEITLN